jgi:outer membrane protein assembly factor BamB/orotate phosphoribosyltransferase
MQTGKRERVMKYFKLIRSGIDVAPLLEEVRSREESWLIDTGRQDKIRVQRDTNTIFLGAAVHRPDLDINENQESRLTSVSKTFPRALAFMTEFAQEMNCRLSRAAIVRLKPQSQVFRHTDKGSYYFLRDRFHLVLQSPTGSVLMSGGERVRMQEGELWWFDNKQYHESYNESGDWRIHYIFDLLPADFSDLAVNPILLPPEYLGSPAPAVSYAGLAGQSGAPGGGPAAPPDPAVSHAGLGGQSGAPGGGPAGPPDPAVSHAGLGEQSVAPSGGPAALLVDELTPAGGPADNKPAPAAPRDVVSAGIRERAILRAENQRLISPKGDSNRWLIDLRRVFMDANLLDAAAELFWQECAGRMPFQVGGMEAAAIPFLSAILMKSLARGTPVNGFIVRRERKTYGTGSSIEGALTGAPVIVVDDVLNSGASMEKTRVVLERENQTIACAYVLIDYESSQGKLWRERHGIPVVAPFRLSEFGLSIETPGPGPGPGLGPGLGPELGPGLELGPGTRPKPMAAFHNRWRFASPDPNFFHRVPKSFPATDGDRVYFGSDSGVFWCLDAHDGSVEWTFMVNARGHKNIWSSPALHDGRVYFGSYDGNVYSLDARTGREVWRFTEADWVGSSPALAPELGCLFIGLEFAVEGKRGSIAALRLENGEKVWEHPTKRYTHASPAYWPERQVVACGSNDNEMFLFDAPTGAMRWRFETRGEGGEKGSIRHAPAFDRQRGHLVTGCADGWIYIVDVATGREVWSVRTDNTIYTVPLVVEDKAYAGSSDKYLYVLDLERRVVKTKIFAGSKIFGPPRLLQGKIYFGACNGMVYEIDPATDEVTGTHQLPDAITNALAYNATTGDFYALTYVNELFAFTRDGIR